MSMSPIRRLGAVSILLIFLLFSLFACCRLASSPVLRHDLTGLSTPRSTPTYHAPPSLFLAAVYPRRRFYLSLVARRAVRGFERVEIVPQAL